MPVIETQTVTRGGKGKASTTVVKTSRNISSQTGKRRSRKSPKGKPRSFAASNMSVVAHNHWRMLRDPCHATLSESAYAGRAGITARFVTINTYSAGTDTAFLGQYAPAALSASVLTAATSATTVAASYESMAGSAFVDANAECFRVIGLCIGIEYIGTELNRSGAIYGGILPSSTIPSGIPVTIDLVKTLLASETRTPDSGTLEVLWFPGIDDCNYHKRIDYTQYDDSHNTVFVCAENLPAGVQLKIRQTVIVEWLPKVSLGMSMPPPVAGTNPPAFYEALHARAKEDTIFTNAFAGASAQARGYAYTAGQRLVDASVAMASGALASRVYRNRIRN